MKNKCKHLWKMIRYCEDTERGFIFSGVIGKIADYIRPFIFLIISKILIEAVIHHEDYTVLYGKILIFLGTYFLLSLISSYGGQRSEYHLKNFIRKHNMKKAEHLLEIDYQWTEAQETQDRLSDLYNMEGKNVFGIRAFSGYINKSIGGLFGIGLALYLASGIFLTGRSFSFISEWKLDVLFFMVFVGTFWLTLKIVAKINAGFADVIGKKVAFYTRYLRSYNTIIYKYKSGKDIRLYHRKTAEKFSYRYRDFMEKTFTHLSNLFTKSTAVETFMATISSGIIYFFVGIKLLHGAIGVSEVLLFIGVFDQLIVQGMEVVDGVSCLYSSDIYRDKLFDYYRMGEGDGSESSEALMNSQHTLGFRLKDVTFAYPGTKVDILNNISFDIKPGSKLAIVGMNGSGKTTLIKLLTGLYQNYSGEIYIDKTNIRHLEQKSYQELFSPVFQDFKLLSLTLKENLTSFKEISQGRVSKVMDEVGLHDFYIKHGEQVYLTREFEAEGVEISGGEAQKIALGRAILKDGKVFILDEPTAALDPISEYEIYSKFKEMTHGKTTIFISHRLSSCKFCDSIVVIDEGKIVQMGTHEELVVQQGGKYQELWHAQAKHYQKNGS